VEEQPVDGKGERVPDESVEKQCLVQNKMGLHARPAALIVQTANRFPCDVTLEKDGQSVNAKSIMGVLMLAASKGSSVLVKADGEKAHDCLQAISELFDRGFNEQM
jgi:phosphocarrier protein